MSKKKTKIATKQEISESSKTPQKKVVLLGDDMEAEDEACLEGFSMTYLGLDSQPADEAQPLTLTHQARLELAQQLLQEAKDDIDIEAARAVLRPRTPDRI